MAYVHYQPTYYHFHVHFCHVAIEGPTLQLGKAHNFLEVIQNIEMKNDYYHVANLQFMIDMEHSLYQIYANQNN